MTDEKAYAVVCYTQCWSCMFDFHPDAPHGWADEDDLLHAFQIGGAARRSAVEKQSCGCDCAKVSVVL